MSILLAGFCFMGTRNYPPVFVIIHVIMHTQHTNMPWHSDTDSFAQTRRALKRHHGVGGNDRVAELYCRNREILAENEGGKSQRAIARDRGIALSTVQNAIKKGATSKKHDVVAG